MFGRLNSYLTSETIGAPLALKETGWPNRVVQDKAQWSARTGMVILRK